MTYSPKFNIIKLGLGITFAKSKPVGGYLTGFVLVLQERIQKKMNEKDQEMLDWLKESETTQEILKHAEEIYSWNDLEYMRSETRSLSKTKFTHPEFIPNYAEVSDIKWFLEHDNGANYFSLTYGHHYLLNVVVDTDKHIIGAIGTFRNTFLFEDYSASLDSLLEDSKVRFNEHWKLMYEANSQKIE